MQPVVMRINIIAVILTLLTTLHTHSAALQIDQQSDVTTSLRDLLRYEGCTRACWRGIEPGVTQRTAVRELLDKAHIEPFIWYDLETGEDGFYAWDFALVGFYEGGLVSHINVFLDICVSEVIEEFGSPSHYSQQNYMDGSRTFRLYYPELGLVFHVSKDDPTRTDMVSLLPETSAEFRLSRVPVWSDEVAENFVGECESRTEISESADVSD